MAYFSQEMKKARAPKIKEILKKYGMKGTLGVNHHSTFVLRLTEGPIDFGGDYVQVNHFHIDRFYEGKARDFLTEVKEAMMVGNHDNSDIMTDYFDVGWYVSIDAGKWNKPYKLTA